MNNKRLIIILSTAATLLLFPLIAMQFSTEVNWSIFDFIIMGIMLFGTGLLCELIMQKVKNNKSRIIICSIILLMLILIWAELAVGIFGTVFAGS